MKFLHTADIHLDSPLIGLERYEGAPLEDIRGATRQAFRNLVRLAIDESVDFIVIAGDLFDGDWRDYNTGLFLVQQMAELREAGIRAFIAAGNHDAQSHITKNLSLPDNVTRFSAREAETFEDQRLGVALHGRSYANRAEEENLALGYPERRAGIFNIGVLHTNVDGLAGHDNYAPCRLDDLRAKGYDYWALGHVHAADVLSEEPLVVYPGNIQGRHARETGAKGCLIVTVDDGIAGIEPASLDVVRWAVCRIDAAGCENGDDVVERATTGIRDHLDEAGGRLLAVRVEVTGACRAHDEIARDPEKWMYEIRRSAGDIGGGDVWVERVKFGTRVRHSLEELAARADAVGDLVRAIEGLDADERGLDAISGELAEINAKLPADLKAEIDLGGYDTIRALVEDARHLLISRILSGGDGP